MPDIARHLEKAEKYLQKGRQDAALREFFEVLREDPAHETASRAADLALTLGHRSEAAALLRQLLERQLANGNELAAATYRKLSKLAPVPPTQTEQVARLLQKTSPREAVEVFLSAVHGYVEGGHQGDALTTMEAVVALEPTVEHLGRLAVLAEQNRDVKKAVSALLRAGALQAPLDAGAARVLYERAWQLNPSELRAALAYARALMADVSGGNGARAADVLKPYSAGPEATPETRALYGRALMAAGAITEVEPFLGDILQQEPGEIDNLVVLVARLLESDNATSAVDLARRLERHQQHAGRLSKYAGLMREWGEKYASSAPFQEYLVELFNATNREQDYCQTLLRLFELHFAGGNYLRASECLDRAAEVDPYEAGHKQRLEMLRGKIDAKRVAMVSSRLTSAVTGEERQAAPEAARQEQQESTVLEDLILQAEIFLQYSLSARAAERLERIRKLFPGEELRNDKLRALYTEAGMTLPTVAATAPAVQALPDEGSVNDIARLTEIARSINRQASPRAVLFTAVNEAGRHWKAGRCIAVLCSPGKPPSLALEYCATGVTPSDVNATVTLVSLLYPLVIRYGPLSLPGSGGPAGDEALRASAASLGGIRSLLVMPLMEGEDHIGLLLLAECRAERRWSANDTVVLKTVADQVVLALSNARLRKLVRSLAVTDEKSGLVRRSSYLDVLLSDVQRAARQRSPLTVALLHFPGVAAAGRQSVDGAVDTFIRHAGQLVCSHIRQNDVAVHYEPATLALVLTDASTKNAFFAIEHLRRTLANANLPAFVAGVAEAALQPGFDAADIVTELINRVEAALQAAVTENVPERALPPPPGTAAV